MLDYVPKEESVLRNQCTMHYIVNNYLIYYVIYLEHFSAIVIPETLKNAECFTYFL